MATAFLLAVALLLGGLTVGATSPVRAAPVVVEAGGPVINITGVSFAFTPGRVSNVSTNTTVEIDFTDADAAGAPHTFTILGWEGVVIPTSWSSTQLSDLAYGSAHPNLVNVNASTSGHFYQNFTTPANPGWYEFVCTEPGHFQNDMYGFISFGEALPANLTISAPNTGPGVAVFIIVGTIVALTVIAIVLGFVVGRREGSTFEMPPERLGYPEPPDAAPPNPPASPPH